MAWLTRALPERRVIGLAALWLALGGMLAGLLALLTWAVKRDPTPSVDLTVITWVAGWDLPGLSAFFAVVNFMTTNWVAPALGLFVIAFIWLAGKGREARVLAIIGGIVSLGAFLGDYTLGIFVERSRPLLGASGYSFPSGHVFGTTAFFGFLGFLAIRYRLRRRYLIPFLGLAGVMILSAAPARMHTLVHWPSDIAAGYLLGMLWLVVVIPAFLYMQRARWLSSRAARVPGCESCRVERSFASTVLLDPRKGTATKIYAPPPLLRLLYWLAFQARFPYEHNAAAIQAAAYRRKIAGLLTRHRFGKDLVSPVISAGWDGEKLALVTELVPGEMPENDEATRAFLGQVAETFAEAGLPVWQVNPRNPHAHTNLIRTPEGELRIIDLESAVVTLMPPESHWRSSLRSGSFPTFDDIDFGRLRRYIEVNQRALRPRLGSGGLAELLDAVERGERAVRVWKESEPRIWGALSRVAYQLLGRIGYARRLARALTRYYNK